MSPVLDEYGLSIATVGLAVSVLILIKAAGAFIASKINTKGNEKNEAAAGLAFCIIGLLTVLFVESSVVRVLVCVAVVALDPMILTNLKTVINNEIESRHRSTVLSLLSLFSRASETLFLTSFGWIIDTYMLYAALLFTAAWLSVAVLLLFLKTRNQQNSLNPAQS